MSRRSRRQLARQQADQSPVDLPYVLIVVTEDGSLNVTVDNDSYPPPSESERWMRADFGALLDQVTRDRTVPVRVEVRETDGSVFTDILRTRRSSIDKTSATWPAERAGKHAKDKLRPVPIEVTAGGFMPGDNVAAAVVLTHTRATSTGSVSVLLDPAALVELRSDSTIEVVLHGRASDITQVRELS